MLSHAREHNIGKIIIGRHSKPRWRLRGSFADPLGRTGPDLDLVKVGVRLGAAQTFADQKRRRLPLYALDAGRTLRRPQRFTPSLGRP